MLISVGAPKGSFGATTFATLLARQWPTNDTAIPFRVVLEADTDGAVLSARWHQSLGVTTQPGLVELVSGLHANKEVTQLLQDCSQDVGAGVSLIAGMAGRSAMAGAVSSLSDTALAEISRSPGLVVADVGRMRSPTSGVVRRSQLSILVSEPGFEAAHLLKPMVAELQGAGAKVGLVTIGERPYSAAEIAATVGVETNCAWSVPFDKVAGRLLLAQGPGARRLQRSKLARRVRSIATDIELLCQPAATNEATNQRADQAAQSAVSSNVMTVLFREASGG